MDKHIENDLTEKQPTTLNGYCNIDKDMGGSLDEPPMSQAFQAETGLRHGLCMDQVLFYYKPEFTWKQMEQARLGFEYGLSVDQVSLYYKPEFTAAQMGQARLELMNGAV